MAARHRPTEEHRHGAIVIALRGLARGDDLGDVAGRLEPLHPRHDTFPRELLSTSLPTPSASAVPAVTRHSSSKASVSATCQKGIAHTKAQPHKSNRASLAGIDQLTDDRRGLAQYGETKGR
jgi:hypothetical protein